MVRTRRPWDAARGIVLTCALVAALGWGCRAPSNNRDWAPNQAVLTTATFDGNLVNVHNVRNTHYRTAEDYTVQHYDATYDLNRLDRVDFVSVPLPEVPGGAHTFLTFGFDDGKQVAISVEVRRKRGEEFSIVQSVSKPFEIMYVVGDERDLIQLRTNYWLEDVYLYQLTLSRAQSRTLLRDMLERTNALAEKPEFYHPVTNNCMVNLVKHLNRAAPGSVPYNYQVLLPLYADRLFYDLRLIEGESSFALTKEQARVNDLAYIYRERADFSARIRPAKAGAVASLPR